MTPSPAWMKDSPVYLNTTIQHYDEDVVAIATGVAVATVSSIGVLFNFYIVIVILLTKQLSTATSILLLHLGVTGAISCLVSLSSIPASTATCIARGFLTGLLHPLQLWTICGLHADRCAAISAPLHYDAIVSPKKATASIGVGWIVSLLLLAPVIVHEPPLVYVNTLSLHIPACGASTIALLYCIVFTVLSLVVPTTLVLLCSLKILSIARHHRHRIAAAIYEVTISAQVTVTHQRNPFNPPTPPQRTNSAVNAVFQPLGSLIILYYPYYVVVLWFAITEPPLYLTSVAAILIAFAPAFNCIIYGMKSQTLKKAIKNYWRKRLTKSEITQEIQARTPSACGSRRPSVSIASTSSRLGHNRRLSDASEYHRSEHPRRTESCSIMLEEGERVRVRNSAIPALRLEPHVVLSRALGLEGSSGIGKRKRSPRITVTRALSDESDSPVRKPLSRQQSRSSGSLMTKCSEATKDSCERELLLSWPQSEQGIRFGKY